MLRTLSEVDCEILVYLHQNDPAGVGIPTQLVANAAKVEFGVARYRCRELIKCGYVTEIDGEPIRYAATPTVVPIVNEILAHGGHKGRPWMLVEYEIIRELKKGFDDGLIIAPLATAKIAELVPDQTMPAVIGALERLKDDGWVVQDRESVFVRRTNSWRKLLVWGLSDLAKKEVDIPMDLARLHFRLRKDKQVEIK